MQSIINIRNALSQAKADESVGIAIAPLSSGQEFSLFSAEIKAGNKVGCHFHHSGEEVYSILSGEGIICTANVNPQGETEEVSEAYVTAGDSFTIPARVAHQLKATSDLVLMFVCSPDHLGENRTMVPCLIT